MDQRLSSLFQKYDLDLNSQERRNAFTKDGQPILIHNHNVGLGFDWTILPYWDEKQWNIAVPGDKLNASFLGTPVVVTAV